MEAMMGGLEDLNQLVDNHFKNADDAMRKIADDHEAEKQAAAVELSEIERQVDDFFENQDRMKREAEVVDEVQNLE
jgi:hypothetical protein